MAGARRATEAKTQQDWMRKRLAAACLEPLGDLSKEDLLRSRPVVWPRKEVAALASCCYLPFQKKRVLSDDHQPATGPRWQKEVARAGATCTSTTGHSRAPNDALKIPSSVWVLVSIPRWNGNVEVSDDNPAVEIRIKNTYLSDLKGTGCSSQLCMITMHAPCIHAISLVLVEEDFSTSTKCILFPHAEILISSSNVWRGINLK
ncbi:hypothetical protein B0H67DRAFT_568417 [Lasiosphaeris hirsuta]|uniref:Uncharacterized protein n=1 Tax=Lasiosphaeris hirsuta TaxID=260670 RepID=A0AA40AZ23_9PEZI|nr:hypothetical protein B0H67DRAFT_568417 [Lasiosphaeris hirsuta]